MEKKDLVFQLDTKDTSYVMSVLPDGHLQNIYYGKRLRNTGNHSALMPKQAFYCWMVYAREEPVIGLDQQCLEYSSLGRGDYREPAIELTAPDGSFACDFLYRCYREYDGAKSQMCIRDRIEEAATELFSLSLPHIPLGKMDRWQEIVKQ